MKKLLLSYILLFVLTSFSFAQHFPDASKLYISDDVIVSNVYPNPASIYINFDYELSNDEEIVEISIHNVIGSLMSKHELSSFENSLRIPVNRFKPGIYFYSLTIGGKKVATKKFIVRK